eukprot:gene3607-4046_t
MALLAAAVALTVGPVGSWDPASWMGDLSGRIGNRSLFDLTWPGTHDSGAYHLTGELVWKDSCFGEPGWIDAVIKPQLRAHMSDSAFRLACTTPMHAFVGHSPQ